MDLILSQRINKLYNENEIFQDFNGYIMIKEGNATLFQQGFGVTDFITMKAADENTIFNIGSITKQFTALCVLQLAEKGLLSIDDTLGKYLPDFKNGESLKIRDLLNMVSGMPEYWSQSEWQEALGTTSEDVYAFIKSLKGYTVPHQKFEYCNSNYIVLGKLIERISGLCLGEYMDQNIFKPLGLQRTSLLTKERLVPNQAIGYKSPRRSKGEKAASLFSYTGAGGIYSTAADLSKWNNALYTDELLNSSFLKEMFQPVISGYGMGWFIDGDKASHGGDAPGFSTCILRLSSRRLLMLLLCNFEGCKESNMCHYADMIQELIL